MRLLVLIPARYASTRFPGKPLAKLSDLSMIQTVYTQCLPPKEGPIQFDVAVVTDDERIEKEIHSIGGKVLRVDDEVESGSDRIFLAATRFFDPHSYQLIINTQGDEPMVTHQDLLTLAKAHLASDCDIFTVVRERKGIDQDFLNPNKVKAVFSQGLCHYFSRAPIPYLRDKAQESKHTWFLHAGLYSYKPKALMQFCQAKVSPLERAEALEQLRAIELGLTIGAVDLGKELAGIDTPEDLKKWQGERK